MDDTAQNPQIQQNQQNMQASPAQAPVGQVPSAAPQPPAGMTGPSRSPEQGPIGSGLPQREATPVDEAEVVSSATDDQAGTPDDAADAVDAQQESSLDIPVQETHPQVEIAKELQEAGVEKGEDAEREQLPEEQLAKPDENVQQQPDTQSAASGISLGTPLEQIKDVEKKNGVRNAIRWLAVSLIRQLKKMAMKPEDQKTTW